MDYICPYSFSSSNCLVVRNLSSKKNNWVYPNLNSDLYILHIMFLPIDCFYEDLCLYPYSFLLQGICSFFIVLFKIIQLIFIDLLIIFWNFKLKSFKVNNIFGQCEQNLILVLQKLIISPEMLNSSIFVSNVISSIKKKGKRIYGQ
jgi:hypothetical protein